jgi:hypothetical protein
MSASIEVSLRCSVIEANLERSTVSHPSSFLRAILRIAARRRRRIREATGEEHRESEQDNPSQQTEGY